MNRRNRVFVVMLCLITVAGVATPASAVQLGAGLHYLRTIDDFGGIEGVSQNDFSLFGTVTVPFALLRAEGNLEWVPDYVGSEENLFQPAAYGLVSFGQFYGGAGIGIGYLTGEGAGWASNPFYAIRGGMELAVAGFAVDAFASYRFQSATFVEGTSNLDLNSLTLAAQIKFN